MNSILFFTKKQMELNTKVIIQGSHGGGCINDAVTMTTDDGKKIFVKINKKSEVCRQYQV
jgi:fructosamine-3-kinase